MAYTYAGLWGSEVFEDADRRLLRNHPFYVYEAGTSNLATLYTDRTKSAIAPNPATTDAYGNGHFYAEPGIYDIESNGLRVTETVEPDPEDEQGLSAYGVAVENGFVGTEEEWLISLKGEPGEVSQAELDAAQAAAIQRANHTGTQTIATVSGLQTALDAKAPSDSPALTGTPTAPTQPADNDTTQIATTAFVQQVAQNATYRHLGRASLDAASASYDSSTSTTPADIDSTNLAVTFTFPSSGVVKVTASGTVRAQTVGGQIILSLREGSTDVADSKRVMLTARTEFEMHHAIYDVVLTGTPGDEVTWKLALSSASTDEVRFTYGGDFGPALMEVVGLPT